MPSDAAKIVMVGPVYDAKGGIASVASIYRASGLIDRWSIVYLPTHCDRTKLHKFLMVMKSYGRFVGLLARREVMALHAHVASRSSFLRKAIFIMLAFAARRPVIFHLHGGMFMQYYHEECGIFLKWLICFVLDRCAVIVGLSRSWQVSLAEITSNRNIISIPNPILLQQLNEGQLPREPCTIIFLGRLEREKGVYELLEATKKLSLRFRELRLLVGGAGNIKELTEYAGKLGIQDRITFLGWVQGSQKKDLLARATIFVLPSYSEGMPMGILEAMAVGLPVVSTTVGSIPDIIEDGVEGILIAPRDPVALDAAMEKLLVNSSLRQQMGAAAVQKVREQYVSDRVVQKIEALYTKLGAVALRQEIFSDSVDGQREKSRKI